MIMGWFMVAVLSTSMGSLHVIQYHVSYDDAARCEAAVRDRLERESVSRSLAKIQHAYCVYIPHLPDSPARHP